MSNGMLHHSRRSLAYWSRVASRYDAGFSEIAGADLVEAVQAAVCTEVPTGDVVELGCGTGLFTRAFAPHCRRVVATDFSVAMVDQARRSLGALPNVVVRVADAAHTGLPPGQADAVVVINLLHIVPDARAVLAEARRLLRPGGRLIAASVTVEGVPVRQLLRTGWRLLRSWGVIPGRRDLDSPAFQRLIASAGFGAVDVRLVPGQAMNAVMAVAIKPRDP